MCFCQVKLREQHHKMTQHLLVDKLKEESDMMKDVDRQIRMLKRCAEKRLEVLKSPTISGICYVRCLDCKDCVAMSRGTQTWSMFEDYDPPLPPHAPVVAVTTPGAKAGIFLSIFSTYLLTRFIMSFRLGSITNSNSEFFFPPLRTF